MRTILILLVALGMCACTRTIYEPIETVRTVNTKDIVHRVDTVERYRDRVVERRGDTVFVTEVDVRYRSVRDTVHLLRIDSVAIDKPVPVEVPVEVERKLTWWERVRMDMFTPLAVLLALSLGWALRKPLMIILRKMIDK